MYRDVPNVVNIIEVLSNISGTKTILLKEVTLFCLQKKPQFTPRQQELVMLLYKHGLPVRTICRIARINNNKFYEIVRAYERTSFEYTPTLPEDTVKEIKKFLNKLQQLGDTLKTWGRPYD